MRFISIIWFAAMGTVSATASELPSPATASSNSGKTLEGVQEIVYAVRKHGTDPHWYANFSYYATNPQRKTYQDGGRLCVLQVATGKVRVLLEDPRGGVRDPAVHYDGKTIVFSYRKGGEDHYQLYTIHPVFPI